MFVQVVNIRYAGFIVPYIKKSNEKQAVDFMFAQRVCIKYASFIVLYLKKHKLKQSVESVFDQVAGELQVCRHHRTLY